MKDRMTTRRFIERFNNGDFDAQDVSIQCEAGWYDWFCKDRSLRNKTKTLGNIIKQIKDGGKVDLDKTYVFFKNNCPVCGGLYDDFRICDIETGEVLINVNVANPYDDKRYAVYGRFPEGDFWDMPYVEFNGCKELVGWLNDPSYPTNAAAMCKRQAKATIYKAIDEDEESSIRLLEMQASDIKTVIAKLRFTKSNGISKKLLETLQNLAGYDVHTDIYDDGYGWRYVTLIFKEAE